MHLALNHGMLNASQAKKLRHGKWRTEAFTLIDCVFACGILAFALGAVFTVNGYGLQELRVGRDEMTSSQVLQQRIEQLRIANWQRITDPVWIRDNILNVAADGSYTLGNLTETVTITPFNSAVTASNTFTRANYLAAASGSNQNFALQNTISVKWALSWNGVPKNRVHRRETVVVLAKGGVAK